MATTQKMARRRKKAEAYRELVRGLADLSAIGKPTSSSIFAGLSKARLSEQHAESSRLARETLFQENPQATLPEELSDKTVSTYLAGAGELYASAAVDYVLISDLPTAFKYFRRASQLFRKAAGMEVEDRAKLLDKVQEYKDKTAIIRQRVASRSIRRRRLSLGILGRLR